MSTQPTTERLWLWVDGVGGFLVCEADTVVIGQPVLDASVDVPILADISRRHAQIRRRGESYLLEAWREVKIDGQPVDRIGLLRPDRIIELGGGVRLRFSQPHPLSLSARLDIVSRHRTQPTSDGILLVHDTLVLGPSRDSHIVCPEWSHELVLYRQAGEWFCRAAGVELSIDGITTRGRTSITRRSRVVGPDFSISLEPWSNPPARGTK